MRKDIRLFQRLLFSHFFKLVFANAAEGAHPIFGDILKGRAGSDAALGVTHFGVVNPIAYDATILFHDALFLIGE